MSVLKHMTHMNDICFFVEDFKGSLEFYKEKFEFEIVRLQPNSEQPNYAQFKFNGTSLTMWEKEGVTSVIDKKYIEGNGRSFMIAIKVASVELVDQIHEKLIKNGVTCIKEPESYAFGSRAAYYVDHEENIWEVFAWMDHADGPGLL